MVDELAAFEIQELNIKEPTNIISFTDGATDVLNEKEEFLGEDKLVEIIVSQNMLSPNEHVNQTLNKIKNYAGKKGTYTDDLTLMVMNLN